MSEARLPTDLPERFALLYDHNTGKFDTPLDDRGIADIDETFELAIRTYPDELPSFVSSERNRHHLYWTERWWKDYALAHDSPDSETITEFRNSTPQIAYVPIALHAWIEEIMEPPPPPSIEVMRQRNAAWNEARLLLNQARLVDKARADYIDKKDVPRRLLGYIDKITPLNMRHEELEIEVIDNEYWLSELSGRLDSWSELGEAQDNVPSSHRLIPLVRLSDVRQLRQRIRSGAIVPRIPEFAHSV